MTPYPTFHVCVSLQLLCTTKLLTSEPQTPAWMARAKELSELAEKSKPTTPTHETKVTPVNKHSPDDTYGSKVTPVNKHSPGDGSKVTPSDKKGAVQSSGWKVTNVFDKFNITLFNNQFTTLKRKKKKETNMFGYEDYSSITMEPMYYDTTCDLDLEANVHYNFTTEFPNNRAMYRAKRWMRYMNRGEAQMIHKELVDRFAYSLDQIAELNGLSVARAIERHYKKANYSDVLVMCGSGNNGLYGFVTARHLRLMGYDPTIFLVNDYNSSKVDGYRLFTALRKQVLAFNIPILSSLPSNVSVLTATHSLIVDAIFGVGYDRFKYEALPRANRYKYSVNVLKQVNKMKPHQGRRVPIVSIDLPSGWDTNIGNYEGHHINPEMLVSLIGPKLGVVEFFGKYHYIAGNYLPPILNDKYQVYIPEYNGSDCLISCETMMEDSQTTNEMVHV